MLASLHLSAAFDTVDHPIFLHRLQHTFGVKGSALQWFHSYLIYRQYNISINSSVSSSHSLTRGVLQGSVLGARMFTMYTYPLSSIFVKRDVKYYSYADDTQVYLNYINSGSALVAATEQLQACIAEVCQIGTLKNILEYSFIITTFYFIHTIL